MHILIIGTMYEPDLGPSAPLFTLLSENLVRRGHQVTVITMVPHYPTGIVSPSFRGKWKRQTNENGVEVIRIGLPSVNRKNLIQRFLQILCYQLGAAASGLTIKYDVVLAANPFLSVWLPFAWYVVARGKPAVYSVQDVYPDVGITLGIFRSQLVIKAATYLERYCLNHSAVVHIISEAFRPGLNALGIPDAKMAHVYDWVDTDFIRPLYKINAFTQAENLDGKFEVLYAGNIGLSQGLEQILAAAEKLAAYDDMHFVFVGDGKGKEDLREQALLRDLKNVRFIPFQPRQCLPEVLASADVELILLKKGMGSRSLPSKIFSAMASGRAIIASVDEESEIWNIVKNSRAGLCILPDDPSALAEAILTLKQDQYLREELGCNGRLFAEQNFSVQICAEKIEKLLLAALNRNEILRRA